MLDMVQSDCALECEPGVIRLFGAADIRSRGMVSGWSGPEEGHTWNDGLEAVYAIIMRSPVQRLGLIVIGEPYVTRIRAGAGTHIVRQRLPDRILAHDRAHRNRADGGA